MFMFRNALAGMVVVTSLASVLLAIELHAAPTNTNVAVGQPTSVSSYNGSFTQGAQAVDTSIGTLWRTKYGSKLATEWIRVNLGAETSISRVTLKWGTYYAKAYRIEVSLNGTSWSTVYSTTAENGGTDVVDFAATNARYVRMTSTTWNDNRQRNWLYEFEIYLDDGGVPPPPVSGSWSVVPSPNGAQPRNALHSVAVVAADQVWAAGTTENLNGTVKNTLIEQWNGSSWTVVPSPNPHLTTFGARNELFGIAASSATDAWAVGLQGGTSSNNSSTLVLHWNGSNWASVAGPDVLNGASRLTAVSALSVTSAWAVGAFTDASTNGYEQTLIGYWNGSFWAVVPSPRIGVSAALNGVTALAPNKAWAVGSTIPTSGGTKPLILQWNGSVWSESPLPGNLAGTVSTTLTSITAIAENDIWAVGSLNGKTLTLHFNGSSWSVVNSPNNVTFGTGMNNVLNSVTAVASDNVWAVGTALYSRVGSAGQPINTYFTTIMRWDGSRWSMVTSPNPGATGSRLFGVARVDANQAWAVGSTDFSNTLTQQFTAP